MAKTPLRLATPATTAADTPDAARTFFDALIRLQGTQVALLAAWQDGWLAIQSELWDEWACRWAGGVPIDA